MSKYIGIDDGNQGLICFDCAYQQSIQGYLFTQEAYPDGFTCEECSEPIADQDFKGEA